MTAATPEEVREATRGLLLATTRLLTVVVLKVRAGEALTDDEVAQARNLLRAVVEIEEGRPRNRVNREVRTAPGVLVVPGGYAFSQKLADAEVAAEVERRQQAARPSSINPHAAPMRTIEECATGKAPDVMALAAELRAERNADRRLPVERDDE